MSILTTYVDYHPPTKTSLRLQIETTHESDLALDIATCKILLRPMGELLSEEPRPKYMILGHFGKRMENHAEAEQVFNLVAPQLRRQTNPLLGVRLVYLPAAEKVFAQPNSWLWLGAWDNVPSAATGLLAIRAELDPQQLAPLTTLTWEMRENCWQIAPLPGAAKEASKGLANRRLHG